MSHKHPFKRFLQEFEHAVSVQMIIVESGTSEEISEASRNVTKSRNKLLRYFFDPNRGKRANDRS